MMRPACSTCAKPLSRGNRSGLCRPCFVARMNADPAIAERRAEGVRRKFRDDPAHRAKMAVVSRRNGQKAAADPKHRAWLVERGRRIYRDVLSTPEVRARNIAAVRANSHKVTEHFLGWCPPEHRKEYRLLTRSKRLRAADARAEIETKIAEQDAVRSGDVHRAADHLRRLAPITRCDTSGKHDPVGAHYRYGTVVLSPGEVVARARARGWRSSEIVLKNVEPIASALDLRAA